jgi:hypothetical protein
MFLRQDDGSVNPCGEATGVAPMGVGDGFPEHDGDPTEGERDFELVPAAQDDLPGAGDGIGDNPSAGASRGSEGAWVGDATGSPRAVDGEGGIPPLLQSFYDGCEADLSCP